MYHASDGGRTWKITTLGATGDAAVHCSAAILPSERPETSYSDQGNLTLKHAWLDDDCRHTATVDSAEHVGEESSLAGLPSRPPAISYHDGDQADLKYACYDGVDWCTTVVDSVDGGNSPTRPTSSLRSSLASCQRGSAGAWRSGGPQTP